MGQVKLKTVQTAMKDPGKCTVCGDELKQGGPYRYFKPQFRGNRKVVRCMKPECTPRRSELELSKLSGVFAAQEDAESAIDSAESIEDIQSALEDCSGSVQEVIDEYEQAIEAMPALEANTRDTIDTLESYISDLDGFSPDEPDADEEDDEKYAKELAESLETAKEEARDIVNGLAL